MENAPLYQLPVRRISWLKRSIQAVIGVLLTAHLPAIYSYAESASILALRPSNAKITLSLNEALERAKNQNSSVAQSKERVRQSSARLYNAYSGYMPKLNLSGTFTNNYPEIKNALGSSAQNDSQARLYDSVAELLGTTQSLRLDPTDKQNASAQATQLGQTAMALRKSKSSSVVIQPAWVFDAKLSLTQPILNMPAIAAIKSAYLDSDLARTQQQQIESTNMRDVAQLYMAAVRAHRVQKTSNSQLTRAHRLLGIAQRKYRSGLTRKSDLNQMKVEFNEATDQLDQATLGVSSAIARLGVMLGLEDEFLIEMELDLNGWMLAESIDELAEHGVNNRPEVETQLLSIKLSGRSRDMAISKFFPTIDFVAQGLYSSNTSGFVDKPWRGLLMLQANMSLFDGGDSISRIHEMDAKVSEEKLRLSQLQRSIESDIRGQYADVNARLNSLKLKKESLALRKLIYKESERMHLDGLSDSTDLIQNSHFLHQSEIAVENAQTDVELAYIELAFSAGRLRDRL